MVFPLRQASFSLSAMPAIPRPPAQPLSPIRRLLRQVILGSARTFGMKLVDSKTGESLGRAFVIPFGGKIHVVGLEAEKAVRVGFLNQHRLTYWKQEIGFQAAKEPDFSAAPGKSKEDADAI